MKETVVLDGTAFPYVHIKPLKIESVLDCGIVGVALRSSGDSLPGSTGMFG